MAKTTKGKYFNADNIEVPRFSKIIDILGLNKGGLIGWAYKRGKEGKPLRDQEALDVGTIVHEWVNTDIQGQPVSHLPAPPLELKDRIENGYLAWLEWKDMNKFELLASEIPLVSEEFQFGGTIDIVAIVKGLPSIIDIKTGDTYLEHRIQIRAYATLWNEHNFDRKIQSYYLLRLGKDDGGFSYHYYPSGLDKEWEIFKHLLEIERLIRNLK